MRLVRLIVLMFFVKKLLVKVLVLENKKLRFVFYIVFEKKNWKKFLIIKKY